MDILLNNLKIRRNDTIFGLIFWVVFFSIVYISFSWDYFSIIILTIGILYTFYLLYFIYSSKPERNKFYRNLKDNPERLQRMEFFISFFYSFIYSFTHATGRHTGCARIKAFYSDGTTAIITLSVSDAEKFENWIKNNMPQAIIRWASF